MWTYQIGAKEIIYAGMDQLLNEYISLLDLWWSVETSNFHIKNTHVKNIIFSHFYALVDVKMIAW